MNDEAKKVVEQKELKHAVSGLIDGMLSGLTWGLAGVFLWYLGLVTGVLNTYAEGLAMSMIVVLSLIGAMLHDGAAGFTVLIKNMVSGKLKEYTRTLKTKPGKFMILAGLIGGTFAMSGYVVGAALCGPTAIVLTTGYPAVGAIFARIFLKESIKPRVWVGIAVTIIGAIIVGYYKTDAVYPHYWLGVGLSTFALLGWGIEGVICAFGTDTLDPDIAIGIREFTSFLVYLVIGMPVLLVFTGINPFPIIGASLGEISGWYCVIGGIFGGTSYLYWYRSINKTGCGRAMALNVTYALWSLIIIAAGALVFPALLVSNLNATTITGCLIITVGTILVVANPKELLNLRIK